MTYAGSTYGGTTYGGTSDTKPSTTATAAASSTAATQATGTGTTTTSTQATTTATATARTTGTGVALADTQTTASTTTTSIGAGTATSQAVSTASAVVPDATATQAPVEYQVTRDETTVETEVYDIDPLVDTANPFGDYAVVKMDDRDGTKFQNYPRGTRVDIAVSTNAGITFTHRFTGYVVERRETEQSGADALEIECYTFDQFLRRNTVSNDQTGNTITEALEDIITTDTPVSWDASNVSVGDEQELTRGYQGDPVETVLRDLAFKSNDEEFGVNSEIEFYFRPRESTHIERGISDSYAFNYDIPELGKETINEVEVWYNDGNDSVVVDDSTDKLDLQDNLGLPSPGTQRHELQRPLITDIYDAEDVGRKYLEYRNATLSGSVTTFGLPTAEPGDTIDVQITSRGIDTEFVIVSAKYRWGTDETILSIVENRGDVDDILSELSESVQRVEMNGADRTTTADRITSTAATAIIDVSMDVDGETPDGVRFVNNGRRAIRDGWCGRGFLNISDVVVGSDGGDLSRSNTDLDTQTDSAGVSETLPDSTTVEYSASITQTDVQEVGLKESDGTLFARGVFNDAVDVDGTVTVTAEVSNDDSVTRGVLTNDGQEAVRDVIADNSPDIPIDYAYGSDGTSVSESDTALGDEITSVSLTSLSLKDVDTSSDWQDIAPSIDANTPLQIDAGNFEQTRIADGMEGESGDGITGTPPGADGATPDAWSSGNAGFYDSTDDTGTYDFDIDHDIPAGEVGVATRHSDGSGGTNIVSIQLDGVTIDSTTQGQNLSLGWRDHANNPFDGGGGFSSGLSAGVHTVEVTVNVGGNSDEIFYADYVALYDRRYTQAENWDNAVDGTGGYLDDPPFYASSTEFTFATLDTPRRDTLEAAISSSWNDTSGSQFVEVAVEDGEYTRSTNSQGVTDTVPFADADSTIQHRAGLSAWGSRSDATPKLDFNGQSISEWEVLINPQAVVPDGIDVALTRAIVDPGVMTGETVREAGLKNGSVLVSRHEVAGFGVVAGQRVTSSELTRFRGTE